MECEIYIFISGTICLTLAIYLSEVIPSDYSKHKPWNFCCRRAQKSENNRALKFENSEILSSDN